MNDQNTLQGGVKLWVVWQEQSEDGVAEEALTITRYTGTIMIQQRDHIININDAAVPEIVKLLRLALKSEVQP